MTGRGPMIAWPAHAGGKYHASPMMSGSPLGFALCRESVALNMTADPIHVTRGQGEPHPVVCRRCLAIWGF